MFASTEIVSIFAPAKKEGLPFKSFLVREILIKWRGSSVG